MCKHVIGVMCAECKDILVLDWSKPIKRRGDDRPIKVVATLNPKQSRIIVCKEADGSEWFYEVTKNGFLYRNDSTEHPGDIVNVPPKKQAFVVYWILGKLGQGAKPFTVLLVEGKSVTSIYGPERYDILESQRVEFTDVQ